MRKNWAYIALFSVIAVGVGCSNPAQIRKKEEKALQSASNIVIPKLLDTKDFYQMQKYMYGLSEVYVSVADDLAVQQDLTALGLIGSAALAAGSFLYGGSSDIVRGAGLGAGTLVAADQYLTPKAASEQLLSSADQLICIVGASQRTEEHTALYRKHEDLNDQRMSILRQSVYRIRLNLRKELVRDLPDYKTIARELVKDTNNLQELNKLDIKTLNLEGQEREKLKRANTELSKVAGECMVQS